jgi:hypothetical protein
MLVVFETSFNLYQQVKVHVSYLQSVLWLEAFFRVKYRSSVIYVSISYIHDLYCFVETKNITIFFYCDRHSNEFESVSLSSRTF